MIGAITAGLFSGAGAPASTTSYESIATFTGSGDWSFTSIPSTYKHLQIRASFTTTNAGSPVGLRFNSDSSAVYAYHKLTGNGSSASAGAVTSDSYIGLFYGNGLIATYPNVMVIDILDYTNTNKNKTVRSLSGANDNSTSAATSAVYLESGLWVSTAAITRIDSVFQSGNSNIKIALYGIKG